MRRDLFTALAFMLAAPAAAQDAGGLREFCADRPGLATPACTVDKGHVQVELGLGDWTLDKSHGSRTDTIQAGDAAFRLGVTDTTELRVEWVAFGHMRERDGASVQRSSGVGDVTIGVKQNLRHPDGNGFSIAMLPFATLPAGGQAIGAGTWGAGLILPVKFDLNDTFQLEVTPEVDAAPDEDRRGRHLAYSGVFGLVTKLGDKAQFTAEIQRLHDRDPAGHATQLLTGLSLAYMVKDQLQLDLGANEGLNHAAPDVEVYFGVSEKF